MATPLKSGRPAILFDLDGTLIDTVYEHVLAWSAALRRSNTSIANWEIHRRIGMSGGSLVRQLVREQSKKQPAFPVHQLEKWHDAAFTKATRDVHLLPGTAELLRHLNHAGVRWAIATTGGQKQTTRLLRRLKISTKTVVTGDDVEKAKPSPDVFALAAQQLGVPLDQCIVVGDSVWDMLAAGRSKALAVGILAGGYCQEELERSGAFRVYANPADMLNHIEDLGID
jgi:HAD superfamily hydrolase (TIGR01549 family)